MRLGQTHFVEDRLAENDAAIEAVIGARNHRMLRIEQDKGPGIDGCQNKPLRKRGKGRKAVRAAAGCRDGVRLRRTLRRLSRGDVHCQSRQDGHQHQKDNG